MRLRVCSHPLRVCTGRNEGSGAANATTDGRLGTRRIDRRLRTCRVCGSNTVEDLKHLLVECPAYAAVKSEWPHVFEGRTSSAAMFGQQGQAELARALIAMLYHRADVLGIPWRP